MIRTKTSEQAKRKGTLMTVLEKMKGKVLYKPFDRSFLKTARSSRTEA